FQESIVDEQESNKDENIHLRRFLRVLANVLIICCLCGSGYLIYFVVKRSQTFSKMQNVGWYERNEVRKFCFQHKAKLRSLLTILNNANMILQPAEKIQEDGETQHLGSLQTYICPGPPFPDIFGWEVSPLQLAEEDVVKNITRWTLLGYHNSSAGNGSATTPPPLDPADVPRGPCWETTVGIEFVRLTVSDILVTYITILVGDFIRACFVRFMNYCWCWDLEAGFPSYAEFDISGNVLGLVFNQGMIW
ncbi:TMC2 protein, partial [Glareola pratincola]|nr:TMC2 protein [Glareola pratincola]